MFKVHHMKHHRKALAALAVGAALAVAPGIASAGAIGVGYLQIDDLKFYKTDGTTQTVLSGTGATPDITPFGNGFRNSGDTSALINGSGPAPLTDAQPASATGFDLPGAGYSCAGPGCSYTNNTFTYLVKPADLPGASYALADVNLLGAAIDLGQGAANVGADAKVLATSAVKPNDVGSSQGNLNLNATFTFTASTNFDLAVDGSFTAYLRAALLGGLTGVDADAQIGWEFSIEDLDSGDVFAYSLDDDGDWERSNISVGSVGQDRDASFGGGFAFNTIGEKASGTFFVAGNDYQVTITHQATANSEARFVPEPASLALLGIALAGLGVSSRRKRN